MKLFARSSFLFLFFIASTGLAQESKWKVDSLVGPYQKVSINVSEGTWMNLDVHPDGSEIVFDLLGDIYSIPVSGGKARVLRSGHSFDVQPRYSPDGRLISFTSDAGGGDNIWVMNRDGSDARQVTKETFRLLNNAVWTADGAFLVARKHFTSGRSLGAGEMWMYHTSGGTGVKLTTRRNDQQNAGEPWLTKDGKYLYYSEEVYPGGFFQYNKDPNKQIYVINRYELATGEIERVTGGNGGAIRPQVSPDGKTLAFVRRVRTKSVLYLRELSTGREWPVYDDLSKDQQEAWAIFGVYANFNWTPDGKSLIFWSKGKIHRLNIEDLSVQEIPFEVESTHQIIDAVRFNNNPAPDRFTSKVIRNAVTSPDGKVLVFSAVGYLYKKKLPNGKPVRLTKGQDFEFEPSFSQDGSTLTYVTWNDETKGAIFTLDMTSGRATPKKVSTETGIYRTPSFSPDKSTIVYQKEGGNGHQGFIYTTEPGLYTLDLQSSETKKITDEGAFPDYNKTGDRIYFQTGGYLFGALEKTLKSIKPDGTDKREHVKSKYAQRFVVSPDDEWVFFSNLFKAYVARIPQSGQTLQIDGKAKNVPVELIAPDAGYNLHWSGDGHTVYWTLGEQYFEAKLADRFGPDADKEAEEWNPTGIAIGLEVEADKPEGRIAFTGARIITMNGDEVIENGVVLVNGNKIEAVGDANTAIHGNATVIDVQGKTIMPGLVDAHAHIGAFRYGLSPQIHWQYYTNMAYGVTTTHDPSTNTEMALGQSEMVKAGVMVGPRLFSTGTILYGADGDFKTEINSLDDARSVVKRTKAFGGFSVKSYNQPRRDQRQQIIQAAKEMGIHVYPEGGSTFTTNLTMILDGHTGIEHNIPVYPLYNDVLQLYGASQTGYTPTLIVNYGSVSGEYYWYQTTNVWEDEKLLKYTPRSIIDSRSRHRTMIPMEEYDEGHILSSEACKALNDQGVNVTLGAHGQLQGLGVHWELWMLQQGGMSNMEALKAATWNGAHYLGMADYIGSLEVGKFADLIVLDKNPLENIRNTNSVRYTMVNGRLYDTETMNEIGNYDKPRGQFYWEMNDYAPGFDWHEQGRAQCVCHTDTN